METLPGETEGCTRRVIIGDNRNKERPAAAVDLLNEVARYLDAHCRRHPNGRQRVTVQDIVFDLHQGLATIYLKDEEARD
jgi:predicted deacylase